MVFKKKQSENLPREQPNRQQALSFIPVRNPEVEEEENGEGILLRYSVEVKPWFQSVFKFISNRQSNIIIRRLQLDTLGSSVWQMVDGKQSVNRIVEQFRITHQLGTREAELPVTSFLKDLGKRGLIAMKESDDSR